MNFKLPSSTLMFSYMNCTWGKKKESLRKCEYSSTELFLRNEKNEHTVVQSSGHAKVRICTTCSLTSCSLALVASIKCLHKALMYLELGEHLLMLLSISYERLESQININVMRWGRSYIRWIMCSSNPRINIQDTERASLVIIRHPLKAARIQSVNLSCRPWPMVAVSSLDSGFASIVLMHLRPLGYQKPQRT